MIRVYAIQPYRAAMILWRPFISIFLLGRPGQAPANHLAVGQVVWTFVGVTRQEDSVVQLESAAEPPTTVATPRRPSFKHQSIVVEIETKTSICLLAEYGTDSEGEQKAIVLQLALRQVLQ